MAFTGRGREFWEKAVRECEQRPGSQEAFARSLGVSSTALATAGEWLRELEQTRMNKCFKIVVLEALLEGNALCEGLSIEELSRRSHGILVRSRELFRDIKDVKDLKPNPHVFNSRRFTAYWKTNPINAWTTGRKRRWFTVDNDRFVSRLPCPSGDEDTLAAMTGELCDYQLALYRDSRRSRS